MKRVSSKKRRFDKLVNPLDYTRKGWMKTVLGLNFFFLYFPIVALVAFSFNDSKRNIVWKGFTFKYYIKAYNNEALFSTFMNSIIVASFSTIISTVLGTMLGLPFTATGFPENQPSKASPIYPS